MNLFRAGFALAGLLAATALAAAPTGREVTALWNIQGSGTWPAPRELAKGDALLELPILPPGLIELSEDLPGGTLRAGELLYKLTAQSGTVYCTVDAQPMIGNENKFGHTILVCLVDADNDGTFEGSFRRRASAGVPLIFGEVPAKLQPVGPARYEQRPPSSIGGAFLMRILLDGDPAKPKALRFTYSAGAADGEEANIMKLSEYAEVPNKNYPRQFEVLGGLFELTGVKDGKAVVRMISPTAPYPFIVEPGTVKL
jgi:hypothetical protein